MKGITVKRMVSFSLSIIIFLTIFNQKSILVSSVEIEGTENNITSPSQIIPGTTVLTQDISGYVSFSSGTYVIDLAGYVWEGSICVSNTADVTIIDSSAAKTGKIDATQIGDAIDIEGGKITLDGVTVLGASFNGDAVNIYGYPDVTIKNCILASGKASVKITSAQATHITSIQATVVVENTTFAEFERLAPGQPVDSCGRNCAIEFRHNATITLKGNNVFENNVVICDSDTHTKSWAESIISGENVTVTFAAEDTDLGICSGNPYKANTITYTYNADSCHVYESEIIPPTSDEEGYTLYTCSVCGKTFIDKLGITLDKDDAMIYDIPESLFDAEALKEHYAALGCEIELYDAQNNIATCVSTGGYVLCDGKKYTSVVYGDTTGDGEINIFDIVSMLDHINSVLPLEGAYKKAGMIENGGDISIFDIIAVLDYVNGGASINP